MTRFRPLRILLPSVLALGIEGCGPAKTPADLRAIEERTRDEVLRSPPKMEPASPPNDPPWREGRLPNGMRVVVIPRPLFHVSAAYLTFDRGSVDLHDSGGVRASEATYLYARGGSAAAYQARKDAEGALDTRVAFSRTADGSTTGVRVHQSLSVDELKLVAQSTFGLTLSPAEYATRAESWTRNVSDNRLSLRNLASTVLFGKSHPYGFIEPKQTSKVISREDAARVHAELTDPAHATLVIAGDTSFENALSLATEAFGSIPKSPEIIAVPEPLPEVTGAGVSFHATSAVAHVQGAVVARVSSAPLADIAALTIAAETLGAAPGSQLFEEIRTEIGSAYTPTATFDQYRHACIFMTYANMDAAKWVETIRVTLHAFDELRGGHTSAEAMNLARETILGRYQGQMETAAGVAATVAEAINDGETVDDVRRFPERLAKVTTLDLARVANKYLKPEDLHVLLLGPVTKGEASQLNLGDPEELFPVSNK